MNSLEDGVHSSDHPHDETDDAAVQVSQSRRGSRKSLTVDSCDYSEQKYMKTPQTPRTMPPTPESDHRRTPTVRGSTDLRSPGQAQSPSAFVANGRHLKIAAEGAPPPDLITQTDRHGNASTPRNDSAIAEARKKHPEGAKPRLHVGQDGKLHEDDENEDRNAKESKVSDVDACAETFYDSLRLVCCCLVPEDVTASTSSSAERRKTRAAAPEVEDDSEDDSVNQLENAEPVSDRPQLLPAIHRDDYGKKCLVLDLDETLVHSSFRAGAFSVWGKSCSSLPFTDSHLPSLTPFACSSWCGLCYSCSN
jgi:hypothetical protein